MRPKLQSPIEKDSAALFRMVLGASGTNQNHAVAKEVAERKGSNSVAYKDMVAMVVDDFTPMRRLIGGVLRDLQFKEVIEALNGAVALRLLDSNKVDLIVSDWNMPEMTGLELLKKVRGNERLKRIPFMLVTAEFRKERIFEAFRAEVSDYIVKPFSAVRFEEKLAKIIPQDQ